MLAQRLRDGKTADEVQQIVVESAVDLIDGCDRAAIGVLDGTQFRSAAATDDVMRLIDELQNEVGEGPCLEASTDDIAQVDNDITQHCRWPRAGRHRGGADPGAGDARRPARRRGHSQRRPQRLHRPARRVRRRVAGDRGDPGGVRVGRAGGRAAVRSGPTSSRRAWPPTARSEPRSGS